MPKRLPLTDINGEVRELTTEDLNHFRAASEVLPSELFAVLPKRGRPRAEAPKQPVNIRLAPDIIATFRATGRGWQTRMNNALRDWLKEHKPA